MSSPAIFNSRRSLQGVATETVPISALAVGDLVFYGTAGPDPYRVRHLDVFPGGMVNVIGSPGAILDVLDSHSLGVFATTAQIKRAVIT